MIDDLTKIKFKVTKKMRYDTPGDWLDNGQIIVYSELDEVERVAVSVHEFIEMLLLHIADVNQKQVDEWDMDKEHTSYWDPRYNLAHRFALSVEKEIIEWVGRSWKEHDKKMEQMKVKYK